MATIQVDVKNYNPTITSSVGVNGWTTATGTWTYASAQTVTVSPIGATNIYKKGDYISWGEFPVVKYGIITAVTSNQITIATNTDYTFGGGAITSPLYSHQANPIGFPSYFNYTPTITYSGGTTDPTSNTIDFAYFQVVGSMCHFNIKSTIVRGSGNRNFTQYTFPIARATTNYITFAGTSSFNSSNLYGVAYSDSTTVMKFPITMNQDGSTIITGFYFI